MSAQPTAAPSRIITFEPPAPAAPAPEETRPLIEFRSPSELRAFNPPPGWNIAGNYHVQRGGVSVVGGAPGVGKSRVVTALAVAGASGVGADWFGLPIHTAFRTMIVQAENGPVRLRDEYTALDDPALDDFIRVCPPPPFGFAFDRPEFCEQFAAAVAAFQPDVVAFDPWNRVTADDKGKDYLAAFSLILGLLPKGDKAPAVVIVAHTRKPQAGERASGRALLNLLAGSYALGSVPRAAFVIQHASDDPEEKRVVWTCCKNNDGELGPRSAWERGNGLFLPVADFDWQEFDTPAEKRRTITADDVAAVFLDAKGAPEMLSRKEATDRLKKATGCGRTACYDSLDTEKGKFKARLSEKGGVLAWK